MIRCIRNRYGVLDTNDPRKYPFFDLIFVHTGQIQAELCEDQLLINPFQALLIYPDTPFRVFSVTSPATISMNHFLPEETETLPIEIQTLAGKKSSYKFFQPCSASILEHDIKRLASLDPDGKSSVNTSLRSLLMMLILTQLYSKENRQCPASSISPEISKIIDGLKNNLAHPPTLRDMADKTGMSVSYFRSQFSRQLDISPGKYLLDLRMNEATRLLRETLTPIKDIAELIGYSNIVPFYNSFKTRFKMTPKEYRDKHLSLV